MRRDIGDVLDRWSIAKLKSERIGRDECLIEFRAFQDELDSIDFPNLYEWAKTLYDINDFIWQLEAGLKSGKEQLPVPHYILDKSNEEVLSKIGLTSVLIRNFNHLRVQQKNLINRIANDGFQDIKHNHASEG